MPQINPVEVLPHPLNDANRIFQYETVREVVAGDAPIIRYVGTDDSEDRYGSVIDPKGAVIEHYMRSGAGVFCFAHRYDIYPIGKCIKLERKGNSLIFTIEFAIAQNPDAKIVYELVRDGFMPGSSIGFIPLEYEQFEAQTVSGYFAENRKYTKWELLELSAVPVPANRYALKLGLEQGKISEAQIDRLGLRQFIFDDRLYITGRSVATPVLGPDGRPAAHEREIDLSIYQSLPAITEEQLRSGTVPPEALVKLKEFVARADKKKEGDGPDSSLCPECGQPKADCVCEGEEAHKAADAAATARLAADGITRAGAEVSKKNRSRLVSHVDALRSVVDDLEQWLLDTDKAARADAATCPKCGDDGCACEGCTGPGCGCCAGCKAMADEEAERAAAAARAAKCATCGAEGCTCGDKCTAAGCGCCAQCTAMKQNAAPTPEEIRGQSDIDMPTLIENMRSLLPGGGEAGATSNGPEGSSTGGGSGSSGDPASAATRSPLWDRIMRSTKS